MKQLVGLVALISVAFLSAGEAAAQANVRDEVVAAMSRCFAAKKFNRDSHGGEAKDPEFDVTPYPLTRADRANGIAAKGYAKVDFIQYDLRDNKWVDVGDGASFTKMNDGSLSLGRLVCP
jgi:hypothetical protein